MIHVSTIRAPRRRRLVVAPALVALGALAVVGAACLPPGAPDPTGTAPFGVLDTVVPDGDGFRVIGWVADPDTSAPIDVTVSSNQRTITGRADRPRPDVGAAYPALGPDHGFDVRYPGLGPGVHQVCVWADNVGRGTQARALGCRDVDLGTPPLGALDTVVPGEPGRVVVAGWAFDPESARAVDVGIFVDGFLASRRAADAYRPDLDAAFGRGGRHAFLGDVPAAPGRRQVCLTAFNVGSGSDLPLGCRTVDVAPAPEDRRPVGTVERAQPQPGGARLSGAVSDPDGAVGSVRLVVDGGTPRTVAVSGGRFDITVTGLGAGPHSLCVTVPDVATPPGRAVVAGDTALPCATVVLGPVAVGSAGTPASTGVVGPSPGHPLERIDRDAGVSTRLRDGSVLWFFADSSEVDAAGNLRYFVNNTAAWAAPGAPAVTRDAVLAGPRPVQFVDPGPGFPACPAGRTPAMWPMSAVTVPVGAQDRVLVFLGNVCLGGFLEITELGVSVAEYWYDPADPPADRAVRGTVLDQVLFQPAEDDHGTAAVLGDDGRVHAYACRRPATATFMVPGAYGPCTVGRVDPATVDVESSWRWWDGSGWVADKGAAAPLVVPDGVNGFSLPVASMSVARDPGTGTYVMAYSPWPGFTDRVEVRAARAPQGPWTAPVDVRLPGCFERSGGVEYLCYAATTQPAFSSAGRLGLGYYDQRVPASPPRGQYRVATVPLDVVVTP